MTNKEIIAEQLAGKPNGVSKEDMALMLEKRKEAGKPVDILTYTSGREIKEGDSLLFGLLLEVSDEPLEVDKNKAIFSGPFNEVEEKPSPSMHLKLISFHPDEYETLYEDDALFKGRFGSIGNKQKLPRLQIKKS